MSSADKKISDIFDDDFEVTYEEDPGINLDMLSGDTRRINNIRTDDTVVISDKTGRDLYDRSSRSFSGEEYEDDFEDDYEDEDEDYEYDRRRRRSSDYDDDDYDRRNSHGRRKRRSRGGVPLAAPIQKGGKVLSKITGALLRQLSLILIFATMIYVTYTSGGQALRTETSPNPCSRGASHRLWPHTCAL